MTSDDIFIIAGTTTLILTVAAAFTSMWLSDYYITAAIENGVDPIIARCVYKEDKDCHSILYKKAFED